jgi:hypothetical protein
MVVHIVHTTANYLIFVAFLVRGAYPGGVYAPSSTVTKNGVNYRDRS